MNAAQKLCATKPKELYMPSQDSLSRRLGPVFAEAALEAQEGTKTGQEAPQKAAPMATPQPAIARAYKPSHGGYPGTPRVAA